MYIRCYFSRKNISNTIPGVFNCVVILFRYSIYEASFDFVRPSANPLIVKMSNCRAVELCIFGNQLKIMMEYQGHCHCHCHVSILI